MSELIHCYEAVIADLTEDIGYEEDAKETALSVLRGRLHELVHVHPTLFDDSPDPTDDEGIAKWITEAFDAVAEDPRKTNIVDELQARFNKFNQDDK
jgi:hypothetical protein